MKYPIMRKIIWLLAIVLLFSCKAHESSTVPDRMGPLGTDSLRHDLKVLEGFINIHWYPSTGKIFLKITRLNQEFLYVTALKTGIGSNDIGLDRGQLGGEKVVKFIKNGPRLLLIQTNYGFRAESDNPAEARAVKEAFATSVLGGFQIEEYFPDGYLIDATDFFLQDEQNISGAIESARQGKYSIDLQKSGIFAEGLKNFPKNTEIEALLTFTGKPKGSYIRQETPTAENVTLIQRHSLVALPDKGYNPRIFDPRAGYHGISFFDFAAPIYEPVIKRYIERHRLLKKDPALEKSEPVEPIIYYLDPGVPEPVRSALLEGASWWNEAFESAGFINAFQVKMLPENADPLDVRYNVIQWVHRSSRGWSYGNSIVDPRTGEILKGQVSLGSLRVRQDFMIAQGLLSPFKGNSHEEDKAREMALARIRQLAAHEVGHTLGLVHNYASSVNDRASVMDYPHPLIQLTDEGEIDLSNAYDTGIGKWDKIAIRYGYSAFPPQADEKAALDRIIRESLHRGLYFISDRDARPMGSAHPYAHLWDNRMNAADELNRMIEIRKIVIQNFGINSIPEGTPYSSLEDVLVPIYLMHRYQLEATAKIVGGLFYTYALKGDGQVVTELIPPEQQSMALKAILRTLQPEFLKIPENILQLLPPKALEYYDTREDFKSRTGLTFDPLSVVESTADLSLTLLLHPERVARLVVHHARDPKQPDLAEILDILVQNTWHQTYQDPNDAEINRTVSMLVLRHLIDLCRDQNSPEQVKAIALAEIIQLNRWLNDKTGTIKRSENAHDLYAFELIKKFREEPLLFKTFEIKELPMGPPIGMDPIGCDF
jgi:hypothetical protein